MTYKLPDPKHKGPYGTGSYFDAWSVKQMQEAYTAGAASRDGEVERARMCEQQYNDYLRERDAFRSELAGLRAQLARKDALLRQAWDALKGLRQGAVAVWSLGGSDQSILAIIAIKKELSK